MNIDQLLDSKWLIWSNEHSGWWAHARQGYTYDVAKAGRYSMADALKICSNANIYLTPNGAPNEVMTPAPEFLPGYELTGKKP